MNFGRIYSYKLELNFSHDEVRLAFPELADVFRDGAYIEVMSKTFDDPEEAMDSLNEDAYKRYNRLCIVNPEFKYERVSQQNPITRGISFEDMSEDDRIFWEPNKLSLLLAVRQGNPEFLYRYTFFSGHESERAAMLQDNLKGLPLETQLAFINNFTTTLQ